jgi:hypothetical protein
METLANYLDSQLDKPFETRVLFTEARIDKQHVLYCASVQGSCLDRVRKRSTNDATEVKAIELACMNYTSDNIEIDDNPALSVGEDGIWVQAWVHVSNHELGIDDDDD